MKTYIQDGEALELTAPYDVASGGGALVGSIFGVAKSDVLSGALGVFQLTGVVELAKVSAQAWTAGVLLYWDDSAKLVTSTASTHKLIGVAAAAAVNPSAVGWIRLNGSFIS